MSGTSNRALIFRALAFAYLSSLPLIVVGYWALFNLKSSGITSDALEYGLRDLSVAVGFWFISGVGLAFFLHRRIDRFALQMANLMKRVEDGDWAATIPPSGDPVLDSIASSIRRSLEHFEQRDGLRIERLNETRNLIRRVLDLVDAPVLVIGFHARHNLTLDYANAATASAFGESLECLEGAGLETIHGGNTLKMLVDIYLETGGAHFHAALAETEEVSANLVADCALVRNRLGTPTRLVVVLKKAEEDAWWRRLWPETSGE